jgi:hypothetical protein
MVFVVLGSLRIAYRSCAHACAHPLRERETGSVTPVIKQP